MSHAPSSAEYAAELDALPLNPATGHTSTRALYEIPQRGAVGADGPAGAPPLPRRLPEMSQG